MQEQWLCVACGTSNDRTDDDWEKCTECGAAEVIQRLTCMEHGEHYNSNEQCSDCMQEAADGFSAVKVEPHDLKESVRAVMGALINAQIHLERLQWSHPGGDVVTMATNSCPSCHASKDDGHAETCRLAKDLDKLDYLRKTVSIRE